jgi:hypothetical protein
MANPVISAITFNQSSYTIGQTITATVTYSGTNISPADFTFTGTVTDATTAAIGTLTAQFVMNKPNKLSASASDSGNRTWIKVSDNGSTTAVFTATA